MTASVVVAARFNGPPASGNGGYVAGLLGREIEGAARVRLHAPPPLERALTLVKDGEGIALLDGEARVASAVALSDSSVDVPRVPSWEEAEACARRYVGFTQHPFGTCFVCGPSRAEGDGLRIFAGRDEANAIVAAPFVPPRDLIDEHGELQAAVVWAALDCSGYFAIVGDHVRPMLLGEMAVAIDAQVGPGPFISLGWSLGVEGRKARCATALATREGRVVATSTATWLSPK